MKNLTHTSSTLIRLIWVVVILLSMTLQVSGQLDPERVRYIQKEEKFKNMRNIGTVMLVGGTLLAVVGIAKIANAEYHTNRYGQVTTTDPDAGVGSVMLIAGVPLIGGGIPLTIIGSKKVKKYRALFEQTAIHLQMTPVQRRVGISYRLGALHTGRQW